MDWTLIVEIITFVIFFYLLFRWMQPMLGKMLTQRATRIEEEQRLATERLQRAEQMQRETQQQLDQARTEAQNIVAQAHRAAQVQRDTLMEQARRDAETLVRRAENAIQRERQLAVDELRREASRLAILAATRVVRQSLDPAANRALADRTIADVGGGAQRPAAQAQEVAAYGSE